MLSRRKKNMNLAFESDARDCRCMSEFEKTAAFAALLHRDERSSILYDLGVEISAPRPLRAWLSEVWSKCSRHATCAAWGYVAPWLSIYMIDI